jgi:hypothetical protein
MSRVHNVETWARRLFNLVPIASAQLETVRFDMQIMENPAIAGAEYQQGTLLGWEIREYLLYRHNHTCAYCGGLSGDPILEKEHIHPRCLHGTNRLGNLVIACQTCNADKSALLPKLWAEQCRRRKNKLDQARAKNMDRILAGYRPTLKEAAAVNATHYAVGRVVKNRIPDTTFWSGGRTKKNRSDQGYLKDHWTDAACVGEVGASVRLEAKLPLIIAAKGHGSRQMCRMDRFGFPRTTAKALRSVQGFKTGDIVTAQVSTGKKAGHHAGRVAVRANGYFNITTLDGVVQGISYRYCRIQHRNDGYGYSQQPKIARNQNGGCENRVA